ncbi:MAG TPA: hypothetical protein EYP14_11030 [Planctomycetaceae bacterium]|nr:hypothetical protein [Planctomycetaceae bacterium]
MTEEKARGGRSSPSIRDEAIVLSKCGMGFGPEDLCQILLDKFLSITAEDESVPKYLLLYSEGVKLALDDSPVSRILQTLIDRGTKVLLCSTCLDYFQLSEKPLTGTPSCMSDIMNAMRGVTRVISL